MSESGIFKTAVKLPTDQRAAYLDQACDGDTALRNELESLLRAYDASDSLLSDDGMQATKHYQPVLEGAGTVIGPYKLLQQIGEGGMGIVYMAEQQEPVRRKVALKIIKPGMDSAQVVARFEAERQALAMMDHQNIAKVFDAGTTETGRPYFVMELVHGIPLTSFCDENRLSLRQRLELFIPVCHAIQHAHQKGIIHRDVKPSNVLVTMYDDRPVPKVIDFGIAKATDQQLTERTMFTQFGAMVGTFEYMSPEQAEMNAFGVDTRSDIYSLGVLLYELLTGTTPLEKVRLREAAFNELIRLIKEEEPPRPSIRLSRSAMAASIAAARKTEPQQLSKLVRGDLDWIVMRCLEKQRDRRYETANGLARDILRYLTDEPIEARPPSAGYRMQKFVRRNKGRVIAVALVLLALVGGIVGTTWGLLSARQARDAAEAQRIIAENEKDQKEQARKQAEDERRRADLKAKEAVEQREAATRSAAKVGQLLFTVNLKAAELEVAKKRTENQLHRSEGLLYASQIASAQREWDAKNVAAAWQYLDACSKDLRGWEYNYLYTLFTRNQRTIYSGLSSESVLDVAFSPGGKGIVTGSLDGAVKLWDVTTGRVTRTLKGRGDNAVFHVAFSPDGRRIVSGSDDSILKVWDAATGRETLTIQGHGGTIMGVAFSPDGTQIAGGRVDGSLTIWNATSGEELHNFRIGSEADWVNFSPDGKRIVSGSMIGSVSGFDGVKIWDATTGKEVLSIKNGALPAALSPDGKRIVCQCLLGYPSTFALKVWDASSGQESVELKADEFVQSVAFSPDGKQIAGGNVDGLIEIWDAATGRTAMTLGAHRRAVKCVAFSPDGKQLASSGIDGTLGTLKLWDVTASDEPFSVTGQTGGVQGAFTADGKSIVGGSPGALRMRDAVTGRETRLFIGGCSPMTLSPDGKWIVSASLAENRLKVWDAVTGRATRALAAANKQNRRLAADGGDVITSVVVSPDGKRIASATVDGSVTLWDAESGREKLRLMTIKHSRPCLSFSPDGKRIAIANILGGATVRDSATGREALKLRGLYFPFACVAFSPDGKTVVGGRFDGPITVWDAETGQEVFSLVGHTDAVLAVTFSADGKRIASGGLDQTLKLWNAASGQETLSLKAHSGGVCSVAFSRDGTRIVSGGQDGMLKIWDASRGADNSKSSAMQSGPTPSAKK